MTDRVSVIMTVFNGERYLRQAVDSILAQTFDGFELLIVDDASSDSTPEILATLAAGDARIRILRNETNLGPYPSANRALEVACAPIIVRMDADDVSTPGRIARQLAFLDANPDHLLVSSSYLAMDEEGRTLYTKRKSADNACAQWLLRFRMCFEHPGSCFRAYLPNGEPVRYDESHAVAQDYELFSRLALAGKVAILPEVLFHYRVHASNITSTRKKEQKTNALRIAQAAQRRAYPPETVEALGPPMRSYMLEAPAEPAGFRAMVVAFDYIVLQAVAQNPKQKTWYVRQTAEIMAHAILRNGGAMRNPVKVLLFAFHARRYLPALLMRVLENKRLLPTWLESFPDV